ncbi:MAG: glycosyltransferase WbuB [Gammaproteobacteria bacterium]|nr:MAG: glycosyltransferase WbuB [Gammaproteobacteria bacterium]
MRILFLSHYFPPEVNAPATRTYEHCKQWVEMGHEVTVVSCVPHHPMGAAYPGYKNKLVHVEYIDGIKAIKILTYITANEGFAKRTFNYIFYMVMAILMAPFLSKADVVISTSPQFFNGLAGYFVSRIKRCPWLLEIRDLWPESIVAVGAISNRKIIALLEKIERFVYRKADFIVPVTNAFKKHIVARGGHEDTIEVIRNGADLTFFTDRAQDDTYAELIGVKGKFVASYVGTHGMAHGLDIIIEAAELLRQREDIVFLMAGEGAERKRLASEITKRGLENITMLGQLPKEDMPRLWSVSTVSLVLLRKLDLFLTVIPSKIFESMAMKKPIIIGVDGESKEIINDARAGIAIKPESATELAAAIIKLADSPALCQKYGEQGSQYVATHFDRHILAQQYEKKLAALCETSQEQR